MTQILGCISQSSRNVKKPRHIESTVKSREWSVSALLVLLPRGFKTVLGYQYPVMGVEPRTSVLLTIELQPRPFAF